MTEVGISLGASTGDRLFACKFARDLLKTTVVPKTTLQSSTLYETSPVDSAPEAPFFYNAVLVFSTHYAAEELLTLSQSIELKHGRVPLTKRGYNAPRPLDIDLLYYGQEIIYTDRLCVPHPRMRQRRFVLEPLCQLRPELIIPGETRQIRQLLASLNSTEPPLVPVLETW